ncbi:hypothetical protein [Oligoflexus tunisiensis]|uniref:hypothetical protein n=1 Tax=Oligoflexus tunisiensis TaxID=708132 RepID=UPI00114D1103|nr:hypothetical protein [Oligoflexus tunisiensis]
MKNSLVMLALLASIAACGDDKKSKRTNHAEQTVNTTEGTEETGTAPSTETEVKPEEKQPVEPTPTPVEPTPVEPVTPAEPEKTLDIVGTWTRCNSLGKGIVVGVSLTFDNNGGLEVSAQQFKDQECKEPALKKVDVESAKATYKVGEVLSSQAVSLDITNEDGSTDYVAYKIDQNQLSITGVCKEIGKESGCQAIFGVTAETRSVDFNNDHVTVLTRK